MPQQLNTTQSGGAFSHLQKNLSGSGSGTNPDRRVIDQLPGAIGRNQRTSSTGFFPKKSGKSGRTNNNMAAQRSQRYEAIISLYDKLLEDEDKLLLQKKKKEKREKRL